MSNDWNALLWSLSGGLKIIALLLMVYLIFSAILAIKQKIFSKGLKFYLIQEKRALIALFFLWVVIFLNDFNNYYSAASADKWMILAQGESTLLQMKTINDYQKKPLPYDRQQGDDWIKVMRSTIASGELSNGQYYSLAKQYNELNIGVDALKDWFKTNSTESIQKELEKTITQSAQQQQPAPIQPDAPQENADQNSGINHELDQQVAKAFQ